MKTARTAREILKDIIISPGNREPSCEVLYGTKIDQALSALRELIKKERPEDEDVYAIGGEDYLYRTGKNTGYKNYDSVVEKILK